MSSPAAPALHTEQPVRSSSFSRALIPLAIIFAVVYLGSVFSQPLLDDADSTHAVDGFLPEKHVVAEVSGKFVYSNRF